MSSWDQDIKYWIASRMPNPKNNQLAITSNIAKRGGWTEEDYDHSMIDSLHKWLDDWYSLEVKKLPKPTTAQRTNPLQNRDDLLSIYRSLL